MKYIFLFCLLIILSCNTKTSEPNYYKNLFTGETYNKSEFDEFKLKLITENSDSIEKLSFTVHMLERHQSGDSLIQSFKYSIRIGNRYVINASEDKIFNYLNKPVPERLLISVTGDTIRIGGNQENPTLVNFWHRGCRPCIEEIPALNELKNSYIGKFNIIAITFDKKEMVTKFLQKHPFDFIHITDAIDYINEIGIGSYPTNLFIDRSGKLYNIEGGIPYNTDTKQMDPKGFIKIMDELLNN